MRAPKGARGTARREAKARPPDERYKWVALSNTTLAILLATG